MIKNINKKILFEKLVLILFIIGFVNVYVAIFGNENILIGVTVITGSLMFLKMDLGYNIKETVLLVIGLVTYIGFIASLNNINILLGFIINVISIFFIMYLTTENVETKAFLPFILMFVFVEGNSVNTSKLFIRLIASLVGGIIIALVLYLTRKNKEIKNKTIFDLFKDGFEIKDDRLRFSIKMAIGIGLAVLIGKIIGTEKGMWISIAVMSLTQPHYEETKNRMKKRLISTIIGFGIFILLFKIIVPYKYFSLLTIVLGYIYTFIEEYGIKMIFVTINALVASMSVFTTPTAMTLRLGFLLIGILLIYLISKIEIRIMNYNLKECL
ncbi:MAG: FUSC family protein [Clostridium sp.]|uniref:FUSC family protein n=1 Tax=Clostridium sp. TaxID=1506 RepID=UPI002FC71FE5